MTISPRIVNQGLHVERRRGVHNHHRPRAGLKENRPVVVNHHERVVPFDREARAFVAEWLEYRAERGYDGSHTVFPVLNGPTKGQPLGSAYVRQMMKGVGLEAGVEKVARPHCWRHTYADYMLTKGVPIHIIQRCLGHSNVATTMRYADHLNPMAVLDMLRDFEWPAAA